MRKTVCFSITLAAVLCPLQSAQGIVTELSADLRSQVQLLVGGSVDSSDEALESFGDSGLTLPISTRANLDFIEVDGSLAGRGVAIADFADPTQATPTRNPEEFGLEADCFSGGASACELDSSIVERRNVMFSAAELGNPVGGTQTVRSAFFPSGAIFLWSLDDTVDLTGLSAEFKFEVRQIIFAETEGEADEEVILLDEEVTLRGGPDGTVVGTSPDSLIVLIGGIDVLPGVSSLVPADTDSLAVAQVAVIPDLLGSQQIPYEYEVTAGVEYEIVATVSIHVTTLPHGTGVSAVFGRPFEEAVEIISLGIPESTAKVIRDGLNLAMKQLPSDYLRSVSPSVGMCGAIGFEMVPLMAMTLTFLLVPGVRSRRRKP